MKGFHPQQSYFCFVDSRWSAAGKRAEQMTSAIYTKSFTELYETESKTLEEEIND